MKGSGKVILLAAMLIGAISIAIVSGCAAAGRDNTEQQAVPTASTADTEGGITVTETGGVYYQPIPEREIGYVFLNNSEPLFLFSYLYYNGSMYTSSYEIISAEKGDVDSVSEGIRKEELAEVYSNRAQFWSEEGSRLSYVDDGINGAIYSMVGYDASFRVCVCYERYIKPMDETYYGFIVFDKLNDITVNKGSDLFKDRLHLDEYAEVRVMRSDENGGVYEENMSGDCTEFVGAMMEGKFIEAGYDTLESFSRLESCTLVFYEENGLSTSVSVFPGGYVSMTSGGNTFIEEAGQQVCQDIIKYIA